ncbi:hypothetical protein BDY24DRAFT_352173 [Mrakia frigida]|uniref:uncharacterized protein n=1 Tax=Mrakia frigida TaxID=29902 RepID=UPI003FCC081F
MNRNLLPFVKEIIQEIAPPENDDLFIIAKGLGLRKIVATLLKIYDGPTKLVLLINATPDEEAGLGELLSTMGVRRPGLRIVSFEMPGKERRALYHAGGLISVTSRILVVDMLTKNIPTEMISGLVVLHAEKVTITSMEAFIVRLYRESNHDGWLKAFSDDPEHFNSTMTPLQTCMKMLSLRRVTLWPRFHASVHASLGQRKADVVELYQPLTTPMKEIQNAIVECMDATLMELRKSCTGVELDDFTVENALFRHFDRIVRGQLDPIWHRVGPKTKRLVSDLTTLRNLLNYLLSYDSITFHTYLESILTAAAPPPGSAPTATRNSNQSPWLYLDAANTLFHVAKRRAYLPPPTKREAAAAASRATPSRNEEVEDEDENEAMRDMEREERERTGFGGGGGGGNDWDGFAEGGGSSWPPGVTPVLEELPKWSLLAKVLEEIEEEISVQATVDLTISGSNTILVMATGDRTCSQLREYLSSREPFPDDDAEAGRTMMERLLRTYFWWKGGLGDMSRNLRGSKARAGSSTSGKGSSSGTGSGSGSGRGGSSAGGGGGRGQPSFKRRRVRGGSVAASMTSGRKERNAETGEAEEQNAELEDEAEEIADL